MIVYTLRKISKNLGVVLGLLLTTYGATAQTRWAQQAGGNSQDEAASVALDASSNAYVVGRFSGVAQFGKQTLTSVGSTDAFLVKYDAQGTSEWGQQLSGDNVLLTDVATDAAGTAYVLGVFTASVRLGGQTVSTQGTYDMVLAKYTPQGQLLWARVGGAEAGSSLVTRKLALDAAGNVYVGGTLAGAANGGLGPVVAEPSGDIYLASYSPQGSARWAQRLGGKDSQSGLSGLGVDAQGIVYIAGPFGGTAVLGVSTLTNQTGLLLARCDAAGKISSGSIRCTGSIAPSDMAVDDQGNCVVVGSLSDAATFGSVTLRSAGGQDGFAVKLGPTGEVLWATQAAGPDTDYATSVAIDADRNVYTTGVFASRPTRWGTTALTRLGGKNTFVVKYDAQGKVLAAQREGACDGSFCYGIAVNARHEIYIAGFFYGFASYVSTVFQSHNSTQGLNTAAGDIFVAKLGDLATPSTPDAFSCSSLPPAPAPTPIPAPTPTPTPAPAPTPSPASEEVWVPNVLTPNGDGLNDALRIKGLGDNLWTLTVYNRWGREVYNGGAQQPAWPAADISMGLYFYQLRHPAGSLRKGWIEVRR